MRSSRTTLHTSNEDEMQAMVTDDEESEDLSTTAKTTPQKTRFRSVNLYKEFAYRSKIG